jgi:hypothetical protein
MLLLLKDLLPPFLGTIKSILDDVRYLLGPVGDQMPYAKTKNKWFVVVEFVF